MNRQRTHHVTTSDGVAIGATVHGDGPPLVFLQGIIGDGDLDWHRLVGHLAGRFTCHLPSMRGRGLSGDHPDHSRGRLVEDVLTYVASLGEPTGLVGWSGGAGLALLAAARSDSVSGVAPFEPGMMYLLDDQERAALGTAIVQMMEHAAEGSLTAAARAFAGWPFNDGELAAADQGGYFEAAGRYVPALIRFVEQNDPAEGGPEVLGGIDAPVLVLHGSDTRPFFAASAQHVVDHVPTARIQGIPGTAHAAPLTQPAKLAAAIAGFFSRTGQPV